LYTRENALEERVKGVQNPRVLHLATHGFESDRERKQKDLAGELGEERASGLEGPMLRSGLYLTGANRTTLSTTSSVPCRIICVASYAVNTPSSMSGVAVLPSRLGSRKTAREYSSWRALQEAGAETVLMSMWSLPDHETQELMTLFYQKWLGGKDTHEALREAQSELRATVKARYGRHLAYYWGAFVLVGR